MDNKLPSVNKDNLFGDVLIGQQIKLMRDFKR